MTFDRMKAVLADHSTRIKLLERYAATGRFIDYTCTLGATGSDPDLGTGGSALGQWAAIGPMTLAMGEITFGTAATNQGAGTYRILLPRPGTATPAASLGFTVGAMRCSSQLAAGGTVLVTPDVFVAASSAYLVGRYPATWPTGAETNIGAGAPFAWSTNHRINFCILYEARA